MRSVIVSGFACVLILGGFFLGFSGSVDDAYITYWSASIVADKGEILNYNLERIEQSSALLQVLVLALLHKASAVPVPVLGHILTIASALATIVVLARMSASIEMAMVWPAVLFLSTSPFFVYWTYGGMEGPLLALLILLLVKEWHSYLRSSSGAVLSVLLSLCVQLSRPEMLLVCCVASVTLFVIFWRQPVNCREWYLGRLLGLTVIQFVSAGIILALRKSYFDDFWPQPVSAKAGGGVLGNLQLGFGYVGDTVLNPAGFMMAVLVVVAFVSVVARRRKNVPTLLLLIMTMAVAYTAFVVTSGGDWMAAGRFWVPVVPLYAVISAYGFMQINPRGGYRYVAVAVLVLGNIIYLWRGVGIDFNGIPLWVNARLLPQDQPERYSFFERHGREHLHDMPTLAFVRPLISQILDVRKGQPVRIMAGQAGMVLYYLSLDFPGQLHTIDRNGLTDRAFTGCPVAAALPRTRNGLGNGYGWVAQQREALAKDCQFELPDIVFDIETAWNKSNTEALLAMGYVLIYQQRGHIVEDGLLLPVRKIGAGQYIAVRKELYAALGSPVPVRRIFDKGT